MQCELLSLRLLLVSRFVGREARNWYLFISLVIKTTKALDDGVRLLFPRYVAGAVSLAPSPMWYAW